MTVTKLHPERLALNSQKDSGGFWWWQTLMIVLLCLTAALVLSLPVFPSQDGPVHLYYADLFRDLLMHSNQYGGYFEIKTVLTPYAFHYYVLIALETVFSPVMSEKILLCIYIVLFIFGFRYLIHSVAGQSSPWVIAGIPFCLHRLVYMGFLNYCLGVAMTMFLVGYWIRWHDRLSPMRIAAVLSGFVVLLLMHPITLAVYLLFIGIHFIFEVSFNAAPKVESWKAAVWARRRQLVLIPAMGCIAVIWIGIFMEAPQSGAGTPAPPLEWARKLTAELKLWPMAPFTSAAYRSGPLVFLLLSGFYLGMMATRKWKQLFSAPVAALLLTSIICFFLYVVTPDDVNGSGFLSDRFPIFWLLFALASLAALQPSGKWAAAMSVFAAVITCSTLWIQWTYASDIAAKLSPMLTGGQVPPRSTGVILAEKPAENDALLGFDPYFWGGAHYFRASHAILLNAPWMNLPIIMLRPAHPAPWNFRNPSPEAAYLSVALRQRQEKPDLDFIVRAGATKPTPVVDSIAERYGLVPVNGGNGQFAVYTAPAAAARNIATE